MDKNIILVKIIFYHHGVSLLRKKCFNLTNKINRYLEQIKYKAREIDFLKTLSDMHKN